ncbi:transglutaminase domain-containing protein [Paenibacillus segetis]|uniref:Transglutaminase n=1 Tax=Paenibacillus segetis TaxID=1325360 RepID=A0ABQ1Y6D9_9BACL|nr:transglutaminase domain-containing protein [Paenibacillus segetis]GGH14374.1 transglutaminase [Paenibacillus segetis]
MKSYLCETQLLDYKQSVIEDLIDSRQWRQIESSQELISEVYNFVRNEIKFGYNRGDALTASEILGDGLGQCNTKNILLRGVGVPCRIQGFTIDKTMQKGALTGVTYRLAPKKIIHAYTEVFYNQEWLALEGVIVDDQLLSQTKSHLSDQGDKLLGYGVSVKKSDGFNTCFYGKSTYIQFASVIDHLGTYNSPDELFQQYSNNRLKFKMWIFNTFMRRRINTNLQKIRDYGVRYSIKLVATNFQKYKR